ncbi:thiolase family protein [Nocardioides humi]|uniref:Thiolase family protein n=2 Tax=Nocardioides humi TaxID=449461 RepID=A0ABN2AGM9_9ACTN
MVSEAVDGAIHDADIQPAEIEAAFVGNAVEGLMTGQESIRGQVVLRSSRLGPVPVVNLENACASGSTALHVAWNSIRSGEYDCVLVVGYEKLVDEDKTKSFRAFDASMDLVEAATNYPERSPDRSVFMDHYAESGSGGLDPLTLARISSKSHRHGSLNPRAQFGTAYTPEEVLASRQVVGPLHLYMCAPMSDGAAAVVLVSDRWLSRTPRRAVKILASVLNSGRADDESLQRAPERACARAYNAAGVGPEDLSLIELHDATAVGEFELYSQIGLCSPGEEDRMVAEGEVGLGGRCPVNTSGGLTSRGHPIGATGVAQAVEAFDQLIGRCGPRQVENARFALTQNVGGWLGTDVACSTAHLFSN